MRKEVSRLLDDIACSEIITVFRHTSPDPDALGSQWGLVLWLKENFPDKKIFACGNELGIHPDFFPQPDHVDDETIRTSLAIITDTSTKDRVDDQRYALAKKSIRIDHHIFVEKICDFEIIESEAGAACEVLAKIFEECALPLSKNAASYLFAGLIMDTLNFKTSNTTPDTFQAASYLLSKGIDLMNINQQMVNVDKNVFDYVTSLRSRLIYRQEGLAYVFAKKEDYEPYGLTNADARSKVSAFGTVKQFKIWCLFTENVDENSRVVWNGSLRSHRLPLNEIASRYHGGGHANACGVKLYNDEEAEALLEELAKLAASDN